VRGRVTTKSGHGHADTGYCDVGAVGDHGVVCNQGNPQYLTDTHRNVNIATVRP